MRTRWSARSARLRLERLEHRETPTAGLLDPSFGTGGVVLSSAARIASALALQPDGKILVGALTAPDLGLHPGPGSPVVFRFNANGSRDGSFPTASGFLVANAELSNVGPRQLLIQPGKGVVVNDEGTLVRLDALGKPDLHFGTGGVAAVPAGLVGFHTLEIYPLDGGKIAAVGITIVPTAEPRFEVVHYTADGQVDRAFAGGGVARLAVSASTLLAGGTVLPSGKILAVGVTVASNSSQVTVYRFNADGLPDTTFHHTGSASFTAPPGLFQDPLDLGNFAVQPDGKFLISDGSGGKVAVVRLRADGSLDTAFGAGGFATVPVAGPFFATPLIALQPDGKVLLGAPATVTAGDGSTRGGAVVLVRLTTSGTPDPTFGAAGVVVTDLGGPSMGPGVIDAMLLQPDGKLLVAGSVGSSLALVRYRTANVATASATSHTTLSATPTGSPLTERLTATVTGAGKPTGTVTFLDGTTIVGAAPVGAGGQALVVVSGLTAGPHHFTAVYSGDAVNKSSSGKRDATVAKAPNIVTLSASDTRPPSGKAITLTAALQADVGLFPIPGGTVTFREGTKVLGTVALTNVKGGSQFPRVATLALTGLSPGVHHITAQYSGDANFASGAQSTITVTVTPHKPATLTLSPGPRVSFGGQPGE
jgi:uncharacterized delta-60 repeat protein